MTRKKQPTASVVRATRIVEELAIKGFATDDERLKRGGRAGGLA